MTVVSSVLSNISSSGDGKPIQGAQTVDESRRETQQDAQFFKIEDEMEEN